MLYNANKKVNNIAMRSLQNINRIKHCPSFINSPFKVKSSAMKILHAKKEKTNIRYIFYVMQKIEFIPGEHKRYWTSQYSKFKIPLPPLAVQKQTVEKIEAERALVESAKKLIAIYDQKTKATLAKLWEE